MAPELQPFSWGRVVASVEAVRERMLRATHALELAEIPYAVAGGNAVAAWVARVDTAAVRNTRDVDILIRRADFDRVKRALEAAQFQHHELMGEDCFLDVPDGSPREAVHILYAGEKVRPEYESLSADVEETEPADGYQIVPLQALVQMKLTSFRLKDRVHLMDMIELEIIDPTWVTRFPPTLADRLQDLLDNPDG